MRPTKKHRIYLVDDNEMYLETLKKHLNNSLKIKHRITTFTSAENCLDKVINQKPKPHIVVLDYFFDNDGKNNMTGIQALEKIKAIAPNIDVILLASQDNVETAVETMHHGAYDYVVKSESAFHRIGNLITNLAKGYVVQDSLRVQRVFTRVVALIMFFIIAGTITAYFTVPEIFYVK